MKSRRENRERLCLDDLLPVVAAHAKDLDHANKDVDEVQFKADTLVHDITLDETTLGQASVVKDLLHIVESEATEDGETTVEPNALGPHQCAGGGDGQDHGGETGESDDGHTRKERTTEVQVLLLLSGGTNERNRAHQADGVDTGASEQSRVEEHQRREERSLSKVKGSPEAVLRNVAVFKLAFPFSISSIKGARCAYLSGEV